MIQNSQLIDNLIAEGWLRSKAIIQAFEKVKREDFLPSHAEDSAYFNTAFPIGFGQTISQPLVVAFMLELLEPKKGEKILDIGSGSGWTTALLADLVGKRGRVIGLEIIPELKDFGKKNISKYELCNAKILLRDGTKGYNKEAPYDKILCSAEAAELPGTLKEQLKIGGRIVIPIGTSICVLDKIGKADFLKKCYPGFAFVPLVSQKEQ